MLERRPPAMNLSNLDFNLLKVLDALVSERNVTRAGRRLGRSQPAVSNALQRLRALLGDAQVPGIGLPTVIEALDLALHPLLGGRADELQAAVEDVGDGHGRNAGRLRHVLYRRAPRGLFWA